LFISLLLEIQKQINKLNNIFALEKTYEDLRSRESPVNWTLRPVTSRYYVIKFMLIISWVLTHSPSWRKFCSAEIVCHKIGLSFNKRKSKMLVFDHHSQHPSIASVRLSNQVCIAFSTVYFTCLLLQIASNLKLIRLAVFQHLSKSAPYLLAPCWKYISV